MQNSGNPGLFSPLASGSCEDLDSISWDSLLAAFLVLHLGKDKESVLEFVGTGGTDLPANKTSRSVILSAMNRMAFRRGELVVDLERVLSLTDSLKTAGVEVITSKGLLTLLDSKHAGQLIYNVEHQTLSVGTELLFRFNHCGFVTRVGGYASDKRLVAHARMEEILGKDGFAIILGVRSIGGRESSRITVEGAIPGLVAVINNARSVDASILRKFFGGSEVGTSLEPKDVVVVALKIIDHPRREHILKEIYSMVDTQALLKEFTRITTAAHQATIHFAFRSCVALKAYRQEEDITQRSIYGRFVGTMLKQLRAANILEGIHGQGAKVLYVGCGQHNISRCAIPVDQLADIEPPVGGLRFDVLTSTIPEGFNIVVSDVFLKVDPATVKKAKEEGKDHTDFIHKSAVYDVVVRLLQVGLPFAAKVFMCPSLIKDLAQVCRFRRCFLMPTDKIHNMEVYLIVLEPIREVTTEYFIKGCRTMLRRALIVNLERLWSMIGTFSFPPPLSAMYSTCVALNGALPTLCDVPSEVKLSVGKRLGAQVEVEVGDGGFEDLGVSLVLDIKQPEFAPRVKPIRLPASTISSSTTSSSSTVLLTPGTTPVSGAQEPSFSSMVPNFNVPSDGGADGLYGL